VARNIAIIRSSYSTVEPHLIISSRPIKYKIDKYEEPAPLVYFLKNIFRKETFRKKQVDILRRTLVLKNVIASLPTGLGKSLCYQLSALLQPGIVMIIDPLRSLMRDQNDNLKDMGIDSTIFIDSSLKDANERQDREEKMAKGFYQFVFVAPERLLIKEFREYLEKMTNTFFSYCIVDEAHCVSEWGHDFRTSYLRLGKNARKYCKSMLDKIPFIALTGTASYDVLFDVQRILEIKDEDALITPSSYQRKELHFDIVPVPKPEIPEGANSFTTKEAVAEKKQTQLLRELKNLPQKFGKNNKDFFELNGDKTNSGIVFCPYKGRKSPFGVGTISSRVKLEIPQLKKTDFYAGSSKEEDSSIADSHRQKVQDSFKKNNLALLVATKAFGMGIDKPNIRYSIHFNMPQSIESFYQEAGRCGRDRKDSYCIILYSDMSIPQEEGSVPEGITVDKSLMVSFHHNAFKGIDKEKRVLSGLLSQITYPASKPIDGIEQNLKKMKIDEEKQITIGFENDKIMQISEYLKENTDRYYSAKMINKANEWCYDIGQFVKKLRKEFERKTGEWPPGFSKNHNENIKPLFEQIRDERDTFKAIYRLSVIGVISDYEVDYKGKTISATVKKYNDNEYISHLQNYIKEYVSKKDANQVPENILKENESSVIRKCISYLTKFVYEKIAAKRREAINAMESAIKTEMKEKGSFERYVNTYFDSNFIPKSVKYRTEYKLDLVWECMKLTKGESDAVKHLEGACTHLLEGNPDNGAFHLMRAFAGYSIDTYDKNAANEDFAEGWDLCRKNEDLEWKEYILGVSKFYLITTEYNTDTAPYLSYLQERIFDIHLQWLKDFNTNFLKGGKLNV
ncbi:MAG: RecQ family ATP-dependent DNA helicase, partial [Candidatus Theseobacter exili]|nr:RecQ family ATP-dependent DNA helicase [Candidatus Theseobacter exili]